MIPNPVTMIRRLTTLEIAMQQLKKDCYQISQKRNNIVESVIQKQNQNVENVHKLLQATEGGERGEDNIKSTSTTDPTWDDLTNELQYQYSLLVNSQRNTENNL
jgi:hypothetical protein